MRTTRTRPSRRYKRAFFTGFFAFGLLMALTSVFAVWEETTAVPANAIVVDLDDRKPHYTVEFTAADGTVCRSLISSNPSRVRQLSVGAPVMVWYPPGNPCLNIDEDDDVTWALPLGAALFPLIGGVGAYIAWFRTDPDGRIRL